MIFITDLSARRSGADDREHCTVCGRIVGATAAGDTHLQ